MDALGGGGKIALQPNYLISQSADKVVLRNFEGVITTYPEPESYTPGKAEEYFKEVFPNMEEKRSNIGISSLMNDSQFNLVPKGIERLSRREEYERNPKHDSLKNKRDKRDQLKEKKFKAQEDKYRESKKEIVGEEKGR